MAGFFELSFSSMTQTIVQLQAPPAIRGRVLGLFNMSSSGLRAFSGVTVGLVGSILGACTCRWQWRQARSCWSRSACWLVFLRPRKSRNFAGRRFRCAALMDLKQPIQTDRKRLTIGAFGHLAVTAWHRAGDSLRTLLRVNGAEADAKGELSQVGTALPAGRSV